MIPMHSPRIVQFVESSGGSHVGLVDGDDVHVIDEFATTYDLALAAIDRDRRLGELASELAGGRTESYDALMKEGRLRAPVHHPDSDSRFLISGTGLTHIGSATTRNAMHHGQTAANAQKSDSMRLFELGLEGGKPKPGQIGAMPEWFYKGDGSIIVPPGLALSSPNFALACAEEPEIVGIYIVGPDRTPWRIGYTIGNDLSDHETERKNFMYVAPSKLRDCSMGPELVIGELPANIEGRSRILRDGQTVWEGAFVSGEDNMSHSIANLEHYHFRHRQFCRPGDLHAHFFGCPVISFGEDFRTKHGDVFEFDVPVFGRPLRNPLHLETGAPEPVSIKTL